MFVWIAALAGARGPLAAAATTSATYRLNIPRQPAIDALKAFKRQTGRRVISIDEPPFELGPVMGSYTAEEALKALLRSTPLGFTMQDDAFIILTAPRPVDERARAPARRGPPTFRAETAPEPTVVVSAKRHFRKVPSSSSAEITFDREDIEKRSPSQTGSLLINLSQQPFPMNRRANGAQFAELRGLGFDATVVTLNGRRVPPTVGESAGSFDLSLLPIGAIAGMSVELEPTAVEFGPSAAGGLVNLELRKQIAKPTVEIQYGGSDGGATERLVGFAAGLGGRRLTSSIVLEHFDRAPLLGAARDRWRNQDYRRFGGSDYRIDRASVNSYYSVLPSVRRNSVVASSNLQLAERLTAFGELLLTDRQVRQQFSPPVVSQVVPASNPYNPFDTEVLVSRLLPEVGPRRRDTQTTLVRSVVGIKGDRPSWHWEFAAANTQENARVVSSNDLDQQRLDEALAQSDPSRALNVFDPASPWDQRLLEQIRDSPGSTYFQSDTTTLTGTLRGELGIGPRRISTLLGGEWEHTHSAMSTSAPLQRQVASAFAQLGIPLTASTTLSAGSRIDRVSDVGDLLSSQLALEWQPLDSFKVRAASGKSVRAASLANLSQPAWLFQTGVFDPARQEASVVDVLVGSPARLEPVTAHTFTAGFSWLPEARWLRKLGAKYWRIRLDDRITVPSLSFLLAHENIYSDQIIRSSTTEADQAIGRPGPLRRIDITRINGGRLETHGVDLQASLDADTSLGNVTTNLAITVVDKYSSAELPGLPQQDRAGIANPYGTIPRWRAVASIELQRPFGTVATTLRHVPAYEDVYIEPTGRMIPAQTLVDLKVAVDLEHLFDRFLGLRGSRLTLGVENVFDEPARFAEVGQSAGYDMSQGDLRQRFTFVKVTHEFR